jgi:hypothetical protein
LRIPTTKEGLVEGIKLEALSSNTSTAEEKKEKN